MATKKKTVGAVSQELLHKSSQLDHSAMEQMQECLTDWDKNIQEALDRGKQEYANDFYLEVQTKKEPKMNNVLRNYFIPRSTCPTPTYDSTVYKYHHADENLEFLWVIPSKMVSMMMMNHALEIPDEQKELLQFVMEDADGTLLKKCKKLNNEL